jgi:DNA-binding response OmpR family regulator
MELLKIISLEGDGDADIPTLVKLTLSINGFEEEALSRWKNIDTTLGNYDPDLFLLDVSLGDADGREICIVIKTNIDESKSNRFAV